MDTVLELLLLGALLSVGLAVTVALVVRRAVRRAHRLLRARVRGALVVLHHGRAALPAGRAGAASVRVRAWLPGPSQQVALVRRDLLRDVAGTAGAVRAGRQAGRPVQGLAALVRRLSEPARELDLDLAVIANEPDPAARQQLLAAQSERLELLRRACAQVRHGVLLAGSPAGAPLLRTLTDELDDEVVALELRAQAQHELAGL